MSSVPRPVSVSVSVEQPIEGIQYLRGIAALMVVFHHARWYFPDAHFSAFYGWDQVGSRGVDIFFVISGFVMAHSTRDYDPARPRHVQAGAFFLKRLIRVYPLYWLATLWVARRAIWHGEFDLNLAKDFLFIPHFNKSGSIWPLLFQGWTINYEMFFYLVFALSMLAGRRRFGFLSAALLVLVGCGVALSFTHPAEHYATTLFYTSNLLLEFVMGVWLYFGLRRLPQHLPRAAWLALAAAGFVLLAVPNFDHVRGLADGLAAVLVVASVVMWARGTNIGWLHALGDASYSIYLFHMATMPISVGVRHALGLASAGPVGIVAGLAIHFAIAALAGLAIHRFVERPMLHALRRLLPGRTKRPPHAATALPAAAHDTR